MLSFRYRSLVPVAPNTLNNESTWGTQDETDSYTAARLGGRIFEVGNDLFLLYRNDLPSTAYQAGDRSGVFFWKYMGSSFDSDGYKQGNWQPLLASGEAFFSTKDALYGWQHRCHTFGNTSSLHYIDGNEVIFLLTYKCKDRGGFDSNGTYIDFDDAPVVVHKDESYSGISHTISHLEGAVRTHFEVQVQRGAAGSEYWETLPDGDWSFTPPALATGNTAAAYGEISVDDAPSDTSRVRVLHIARLYHLAAKITYNLATGSISRSFLGPITKHNGDLGSFNTLSFFQKPDGGLWAISPGWAAPGMSESVVLRQTNFVGALDQLTPMTSSSDTAFRWMWSNDNAGSEVVPGESYDIAHKQYYGMGHKVQCAAYVEGDYVFVTITGGNTYKQNGDPANDYPSYGVVIKGDLTKSDWALKNEPWDVNLNGISFMRGLAGSPAGGGIWGPQIFKRDGNYYALSEHVGSLMETGNGYTPADLAHGNFGNLLSDSQVLATRDLQYGGSSTQYNEEISSHSILLKMDTPSGWSLNDAFTASLPFPVSTKIYIRSTYDNSYLSSPNYDGAIASIKATASPSPREIFTLHRFGDFFTLNSTESPSINYMHSVGPINGDLIGPPPENSTSIPTDMEKALVQLIYRPSLNVNGKPAFHIVFADDSRALWNQNGTLEMRGLGDGNSGSRAAWYVDVAP